MINLALHEVDGIVFVANIDRTHIGHLLRQYMHTTYKIAGGVVYYVNGRNIILPEVGDGFEVIFDERINDFITDGSSDLFDLLKFLVL